MISITPPSLPARQTYGRREFLSGVAGAVALAAPGARQPVTLGLIADPHHGLAPDAQRRLETFMGAVEEKKPDLLVQMGDFCHPPRAVKSAGSFLETFNSFRGPRFHVLGNHDLDHAKSKREILDAWEIKSAVYSFDHGGFHFVVLDCNFVRGTTGTYRDWKRGNVYEGYVHPDEIAWLKANLAKTENPTIVISHQGFGPKDKGGVVPNGADVRRVLREAKRVDGSSKVILCLHGHNHVDALTHVEGIPYLSINSASYHWVGEKYGRMAPYEDSLYAFLTLDPRGEIRLEGKESRFRKPTPTELKYPRAREVSAKIEDRKWRFLPRS